MNQIPVHMLLCTDGQLVYSTCYLVSEVILMMLLSLHIALTYYQFFVLFALYRLCFFNSKSLSFRVVADSVALVALSLAVAFLDPTTESLFRIHADTPALVFLLLSIVLLKIFCDRKNQIWLFLSALCLCLSFWAKLPTLPACILPAIFFATNGKWKSFVLFLLHLTFALIITLAFVAIFYGVNDSKFILLDHISQNKWSDRNSLFYGKGAGLLQMNYFEAIPLLFRFFVMYIEQYWIIIIGVIGVFSFLFLKISTLIKVPIIKSFFRLFPNSPFLSFSTCSLWKR